MDLDAVRRSLEAPAGGGGDGDGNGLRPWFYNDFIVNGLHIDAIEPGRILFSMTVPPRLTNVRGHLHGGVIATLVDIAGSAAFYTVGIPISGVSLEISHSSVEPASVDEEIEIEAKILLAGKAVGVSTVEIRKKNGKAIAQARHTKYLAASSKL